MVFAPPPRYPYEFRAARIRGDVLAAFIVDESGNPTQVQFASASDIAFGESAVMAIRHWRFRPAVKDGKTVPCLMELPVNFRIQQSD